MGRLSLLRGYLGHVRLPRVITNWVFPAAFVIAIIVGVHSNILASSNPSRNALIEYLRSDDLPVGSESIDGYMQTYYIFNGRKVYITNSSINHTDVDTDGQYITWVEEGSTGAGKIVLYDVINESRTVLTRGGSHQKPIIQGGRVVWEGWDTDRWQVFYFDGQEITQVSHGEPSGRAQLQDGTVLYAQKGSGATWYARHYDVDTKQTSTIYEGEGKDTWPHFENGEIKVDYYDQIGR